MSRLSTSTRGSARWVSVLMFLSIAACRPSAPGMSTMGPSPGATCASDDYGDYGDRDRGDGAMGRDRGYGSDGRGMMSRGDEERMAFTSTMNDVARTWNVLYGPSSDGGKCVGSVMAPNTELAEEIADETLGLEALGASGAGKLCQGRTYKAKKAITVYRVWSSSSERSKLGSWWSFGRPTGSKASYLRENAICPEWNPEADRLTTCKIKVDAKFVVGPGQSATCRASVEYGKSEVNQVYIRNDYNSSISGSDGGPAANRLEDCTTEELSW